MRARMIAAAVAAVLGTALMGCEGTANAPEPDGRPENPNQPQLVYSVEDVQVLMNRKMPPGIVIVAKGQVRTGGWSDAELKPLQTFAPEGDTMSFTLVAKPPAPDMMVIQAIQPIEARLAIDPLPEGLKTIRVMAETGEKTASITP